MDELLKRKLKKVADNQADMSLAQLDATLELGDKLEKLGDELQTKITEGVVAIEMDAEDLNKVFSDVTEVNESISEEIVSVLKEIRDKEEQEYPEYDDAKQIELLEKIVENSQKEVLVTVKAPEVFVDAPVVNVNQESVISELKNISNILSQEEIETIEKTEIVDEKGKTVNFKSLFDSLAERIGSIKISGGGSSFPTNSQNDLAKLAANYATQIDDTSTASVTYIGKAPIGSSSASAVWQIQKIDESTSPSTIKWADGNDSFDNIFNNRTSLTYN